MNRTSHARPSPLAAAADYFTDGIRLVVFLAREPVPVEQVANLNWDQTGEGPVAFGQSEAAFKPEPVQPR